MFKRPEDVTTESQCVPLPYPGPLQYSTSKEILRYVKHIREVMIKRAASTIMLYGDVRFTRPWKLAH